MGSQYSPRNAVFFQKTTKSAGPKARFLCCRGAWFILDCPAFGVFRAIAVPAIASKRQPRQDSGEGRALAFSGEKVLALPVAAALGLLLVSLQSRVQENPALLASTLGAAAGLLLWLGWQWLGMRRAGASPAIRLVARRQHYIQALVQGSVLLYWGYYWSPVYDHFWLLAAQLLFAYGFDALLAFSRRREYPLGFGPFPIIFSINLFLWFRDDWFYLQFLMIAAGFMGKEYVRWMRDGRSVHIFNPSAFALGLFSLALIATGTTGLTWGREIASTLTLAPNIYTFLFFAGLVVMSVFSITLVAGMAAVSLFALSGMYFAITGVPYFIDSEIPAAVFLGLHLLVTDPSTSPRTPLGKALFGILYGVGVFALYTLLGALGAPTFYDKLLCVPLLNLSVIAIDRAVKRIPSQSWAMMWKAGWNPARANPAHMALWVAVFAGVSLAGHTDSRHTGDSVPFWQQACAESRLNACGRLLQLQATYCGDNSAWACNELGAHYREGRLVEADAELALAYFSRACELKSMAACQNLLRGDALLRSPPGDLDLRLLLREGGANLLEAHPAELRRRACEHGWAFACAENRA